MNPDQTVEIQDRHLGLAMTFFAAAVLVVATAVVGTAQQEYTDELRANYSESA